MASARHMVTRDAGILDGTPVVGGTRVPVFAVASALRDTSMAEVLRAFPALSARQVELCAIHEEAYAPEALRRVVVERIRRDRSA